MDFVNLPSAVMLRALKYLDFQSLISAVSTCKKLYMEYSDLDTLWRGLIFNTHLVSISRVPVELGTSFRAIFFRIQRHYDALTAKPSQIDVSCYVDGYKLFQSLVVRGLLEHSLGDGKRLAAMQLRATRGPWNSKTFKADFHLDSMMSPLLLQQLDERRMRATTNAVVKVWRDLPKVPQSRAYLEYVHFALTLPAVGARRFTVKQLPSNAHQIKLPSLGRNQILCITRFSVVFVSLNSHQVLSVHPLSSLHTWVIISAASSFGLKFLVGSTLREYLFHVTDPREIDLAIRSAIHSFNRKLSKLRPTAASRPVSEELEPADMPAISGDDETDAGLDDDDGEDLAPNFGPVVEALRDAFRFHDTEMDQLQLADVSPLLEGYQRLASALEPTLWRAVHVRISGYSTFSTVRVAHPTLAALMEAVRPKIPVSKSVVSLLWLPDTRIADDEDVLCLPPLAQIEIELAELEGEKAK